ncbi:MAG: hypothetical protein QOI76_951 [Frankiales bacterium]|jgi:hypothetical protein|nr:hypothetical protein [Frankiales bacterium]
MRTGLILLLAIVVAGCGEQVPRPVTQSVLPTVIASPSTRATAMTAPPSAQASPSAAWDIAWVALPMPAPSVPAPLPTTPPPAGAPACTNDQLAAKSLGYSGVSQDDGDVIDVRNMSARTCLLDGPVHAILYGKGAPPLEVSGVGRDFPSREASFDMNPGASTNVSFHATSGCLSAPAKGVAAIPVTSASIAIPSGGSVTVTGLNMPRACGITVDRFTQELPEPTYPPAPLQGAKMYLQAPATVRAGQTFDFVVTLANPTGAPITMTPCPGYAESMSAGTTSKGVYGLNCAGHTSLAPHQRLRFQMRMQVGADAASGPATLYWNVAELVTGARAGLMVIGNDIPCQADQLTASAPDAARPIGTDDFYGVKDSGTSLSVTLTNRSATTCTLQGSPTVSISSSHGTTLPVPMAKGEGVDRPLPYPAQIRLTPGSSAQTRLSWHTRWCGADPNPVTVTLTLPSAGGAVTVLPAKGWVPPDCKTFTLNALSATQFSG